MSKVNIASPPIQRNYITYETPVPVAFCAFLHQVGGTNVALFVVALVLLSLYLYNLAEKHSSGWINYGYRTHYKKLSLLF